MTMNDDIPQVLLKFKSLDRALIDASSLIYMGKSGFLEPLMHELDLHTLPEVFAETGTEYPGIAVIRHASTGLTADENLVAYALASGMPLISEDRKILLRMRREKYPYFNALMMLNFLLFRDRITPQDYDRYLKALHKTAWYGPRIWDFGKRLSAAILAMR